MGKKKSRDNGDPKWYQDSGIQKYRFTDKHEESSWLVSTGMIALVLSLLCGWMIVNPQLKFESNIKEGRWRKRQVMYQFDADRVENLNLGMVEFLVDIDCSSLPVDYLAICIVPPGVEIGPFQQGVACGGTKSLQVVPEVPGNDGDDLIVMGSKISAEIRKLTTSQSLKGAWFVFLENHSPLLIANFKFKVQCSYHSRAMVTFWFHLINDFLAPYFESFRSLGIKVQHEIFPYAFARELNKLLHRIDESMGNNVVMTYLRPESCTVGDFLPRFVVLSVCMLNVVCFFAFKDVTTFGTHPFLPGGWSLSRILTSNITHTNFEHIAANVVFIYLVGEHLLVAVGCDTVEWAFIYVAAGITGAVVSLMWRYLLKRDTYSVGASGSCSGLQMALVILRPRSRVTVLDKEFLSAAWVLAVSCLREMGRKKNVDSACHVGGMIAGFVLGQLRIGLLNVPAAAPPPDESEGGWG